jgi:DNA gyrase subunit A
MRRFGGGHLSPERYEELKQAEQFVLTVSEKGSGKRSSSYDFRVIGRGGKGIRATDISKTAEIGPLVAAFPVGQDDQIMLVTDRGKVIRVPVGGIRIASRATKGVKIFTTAEDERVVSVEHIPDVQSDEDDEMPVKRNVETPPDQGSDGVTLKTDLLGTRVGLNRDRSGWPFCVGFRHARALLLREDRTRLRSASPRSLLLQA